MKPEEKHLCLEHTVYFYLEGDNFCHSMKTFQDQMRALDLIQNDPELSSLLMIQAPLVDVEIRGVPALKFLGDIIWK